MKKLVKSFISSFFLVSLLLCFLASISYASDFIVPNSSGEPIVIDISNLNLSSSVDVTIGDFSDQARPYRDANTKSLVISPPPLSSSEKTIQVSAGGSSITRTISFRSSPKGILRNSLLPNLKESKGGNSVTKISDGRIVLIGGGKEIADTPLSSLEIYNPESGRSSYLKDARDLKRAKLKKERSQHSATYLGINSLPLGMITGAVEQILITGGFTKDGQIDSSVEIVEIKVGTDIATSTLLSGKHSKLKKARVFHTASLLPDGRILIVGGQGRISMANLGAISSIEIFDPVSRTIQTAGISLKTPRLLHTATTLQNGDILITGGFTNEKQGNFGFGPATDLAELINTKNLTIKNVGLLKEAVGGHDATLLTNGLVLITGGNSHFFSGKSDSTKNNNKEEVKGLTKDTIQFYNPNTESFELASNQTGEAKQNLDISRFLHKAILLPNGDIAVIGGLSKKISSSEATSFVDTPVSTIEVYEPDLFNFSGSSLKLKKKSNLETFQGRILPTAILVSPKNKTEGLLSLDDSKNFVNSGVYITGGFTNGFGKLPSQISELLQIESNRGVEGRDIKLLPEAVIRGSYISDFLVKLDEFSVIPSLQVNPQTINLSSSNNFMTQVKVLSTNNNVVLLKAETSDQNGSIIVSPSLFQVGENVTISRKDSSVQGQFDVIFSSASLTDEFIPAILKVNVLDVAKPFLSTLPPFGISLINDTASSFSSQKIQVKVLSQDGVTELTSVPSNTGVTATVSNPEIANLESAGLSSATGTLATQFTVMGIKPGSTNLNFSINFPDILPLTFPVQVSGTPKFSSTPIDTTIQASLIQSGVEFSNTETINSSNVSVMDLTLSSVSSLFPIYVPVNLQSSVDNSTIIGSFTIRPVFGVDLFTALPRSLVNKSQTGFRNPLVSSPSAIEGIVPIAILASLDGIRQVQYNQNISQNIVEPLTVVSNISRVKKLKLFEVNNVPKIVALKDSMILVLDSISGDIESSSSLSGEGFELELVTLENELAAVVSIGSQGIDLVFPLTNESPRVVNFQTPGNIRHISIANKLGNKSNPVVISYDGTSLILLTDLVDLNADVQTIKTQDEKITNIAYAGKFIVNSKSTDILVATTQRGILLYDLNNLISIPTSHNLDIKNSVEDLLVIDGIAYLALGSEGILAVSIGSLLSSDEKVQPTVGHFKKSKLTVIKPNGKQTFITKNINSKILAPSKPFLLSSGPGNDLTIIRVSP
ncbi:MAG: hypothetical protein HYY52_08200 [Candidatus Melainabacteria bacterium]|nr:hypothetical protein [Candidatus Melainabacteria bacterium]